MITMTLIPLKMGKRQQQTDEATTEWDGKPFVARSAHGATMALARQLVAAGCPDQPWQAVDDDLPAARLLFGNSLHRLARVTIGSGKLTRYEERPAFLPRSHQDGV